MNVLKGAWPLLVADEIYQAVKQISESDVARVAERILEANRVFVAGAGRSGLMGRAFAMRLMQAGIPVYVVGETVTPAIKRGDLLLIGSGSGETRHLAAYADKASALEAEVVLITLSSQSTIGRRSNHTIQVPGVRKDRFEADISLQPMGTLFEQTLLLFYDAVLLCLMQKLDINTSNMYENHANLE
ncbi:6-phospho-3-hexuloisomerase [Paenibacillus sp. GCM10023248]|uniref:6-phospho-3-hexuloisomerase n=1 Tax=Bacillales TaxID=1385 RepID=UPI0023791C22|nr:MULTISPECIES: 6-phospho-3-hexuloisomerase [Bacillales]MDD9267114.1 6-phospho-3-hexuloisomerase [Paenibacillus sp. MAHUQ-63]MDR6881332.1 6-phospho-3-hexuloisomerase [Bacillus sp. 3255]